jgi:RecR protein
VCRLWRIAAWAPLSKRRKAIADRVTLIGVGIPVGSDLEYADKVTVMKTMEGRAICSGIPNPRSTPIFSFGLLTRTSVVALLPS